MVMQWQVTSFVRIREATWSLWALIGLHQTRIPESLGTYLPWLIFKETLFWGKLSETHNSTKVLILERILRFVLSWFSVGKFGPTWIFQWWKWLHFTNTVYTNIGTIYPPLAASSQARLCSNPHLQSCMSLQECMRVYDSLLCNKEMCTMTNVIYITVTEGWAQNINTIAHRFNYTLLLY